MNPLNQWLKLEQMDEENPRFEEFMHEMNISNRSEVERYASLCAYKIFVNGACVRINKQLGGGQRQGLTVLRFAGVNIDVLLFDDYYYTELNSIFLYQRKQDGRDASLCQYCYHELCFDHKSRTSFCSRCDFKMQM